MKKSGKQQKRSQTGSKGKRNSNRVKGGEPSSDSRRAFLNRLQTYGLAAIFIGGVGYYSISQIQAARTEADLSKIGNGLPSIVQIHDPQCRLCKALQDQTREVLATREAGSYEYMVANINTRKGKNLAARYGVPHVTLLFFDPQGTMTRTVQGPIGTAPLGNAINTHLDKYK